MYLGVEDSKHYHRLVLRSRLTLSDFEYLLAGALTKPYKKDPLSGRQCHNDLIGGQQMIGHLGADGDAAAVIDRSRRHP